MDIGDVVSDALKYPLSDWTKILMLGIILVIAGIGNISRSLVADSTLISVLGIIGFIVGLLGYGYFFRIIKSSLAGISELPSFDDFVTMFIDGIKVAVVGFVYSIPAIILILIFAASIIISVISNPSSIPIGALIGAGVGIILAMLYMLIITPIIAVAVANMAYNDSEFSAAFRFSEIFDKIGTIGWGNLILWYIVTIIVYIVIAAVGGIITGLFSLISPVLTVVLMALIVTPYLQMYVARSVALLYSSQDVIYGSQQAGTAHSK
ncbi:DUF4013 domain-containing protein [Methanobacterium sp. MBAC-LM]|uniref:DUF4013 domain-containing protein n=1 Tax=Methanobacterium sp. MBAC-LM TaxID=3412034 RepID=UPI003C72ACB4